MDANAIQMFVSQTLPILAPYLPLMAGKAAEKAGEELPAAVGKVWQAIHKKFAGKPAAKEAADDLVKDPQNTDVQAAFRLQLRKALEEDENFRAELGRLLAEAGTGHKATLHGDGVIVQGDGNVTAGPGAVINFGDVEGGIHTGKPPRQSK